MMFEAFGFTQEHPALQKTNSATFGEATRVVDPLYLIPTFFYHFLNSCTKTK
jgi:hypothetical protein